MKIFKDIQVKKRMSRIFNSQHDYKVFKIIAMKKAWKDFGVDVPYHILKKGIDKSLTEHSITTMLNISTKQPNGKVIPFRGPARCIGELSHLKIVQRIEFYMKD